MQRQRQMQTNRKTNEPSFNNTAKPYKQATTSSIKQLIQLDTANTTNRLTNANNKLLDLIDTSNRNYLIKYPLQNQQAKLHHQTNPQMKQSASFNLIEAKCNCHENDYDEINSFSEEDNYSDYDHLNLSSADTNSNHYLQPAYKTMRKSQQTTFPSKPVLSESNYYHLYRKNSSVSNESVPPPIPKSRLPSSNVKPYTIIKANQEQLNKSFTTSSLSSDKLDSQLFLSPISSGYNSTQDIRKSEYYYYENDKQQINSSNDYNCIDSGFSTLNLSTRTTSDDDDDASSQLSPYYSSPSASSSISSINQHLLNSDEQINMIQASPFPRVNTSYVAQIKQINNRAKQCKSKEPIYENIRSSNLSQSTNQTPKQYSISDIYNSLKSLDLNPDSHVSRTLNRVSRQSFVYNQHQQSHLPNKQRLFDYNDLLCDQEVEFYLSNSNTSTNFNDESLYFNNTTSSTSKIMPNRVNAFWEQLV